jgi:hypothetical protein
MRNSERNELIVVIKNIPESERTQSITNLWKRHGSGFTYATFRNYLYAFGEVIKNNDVGPTRTGSGNP